MNEKVNPIASVAYPIGALFGPLINVIMLYTNRHESTHVRFHIIQASLQNIILSGAAIIACLFMVLGFIVSGGIAAFDGDPPMAFIVCSIIAAALVFFVYGIQVIFSIIFAMKVSNGENPQYWLLNKMSTVMEQSIFNTPPKIPKE